MTEQARRLLHAMRRDLQDSARLVRRVGSVTIQTSVEVLGQGDPEEGLLYHAAMIELVGLGLAKWITSDEIRLTEAGMDWSPDSDA